MCGLPVEAWIIQNAQQQAHREQGRKPDRCERPSPADSRNHQQNSERQTQSKRQQLQSAAMRQVCTWPTRGEQGELNNEPAAKDEHPQFRTETSCP